MGLILSLSRVSRREVTVLSDALLVPLGIVAGGVTTLAGLGGGLLLVSVLGAWLGMHDALVLSTCSLFVSNIHRSFLLRDAIDRPTLRLFALGALPGALLGAFSTQLLSNQVLALFLLASTSAAFARAFGWIRIRARPGVVAPAGFGIGALAGCSGGAAVLVAPLYLSIGLSGSAFVATTSASAVVVHASRIVGYGMGGLIHLGLATGLALLLVGLLFGNWIGLRLRPRIPATHSRWLELGTLAAATILTLVASFRG